MTYTYVEMPVSEKTYQEIRHNLVTAGYFQAIHGQALDMHGIALIPLPSEKGAMKCAPAGNKILPVCSCGRGARAAFIIKGKAMCFVCKENYEKEKAAKAQAKGRQGKYRDGDSALRRPGATRTDGD